LGQSNGGAPGPVVVDRGHLVAEWLALCAYLSDFCFERFRRGEQSLVGVGECVEAEDRIDRVEEFARRAGDELAQFGGGQERPVELQRFGQAEAGDVVRASLGAGDEHVGDGQVGAGRP
jgi:hypothetical protein